MGVLSADRRDVGAGLRARTQRHRYESCRGSFASVRGDASTRRDVVRCVRERWCGSVRRGVRRSGGAGGGAWLARLWRALGWLWEIHDRVALHVVAKLQQDHKLANTKAHVAGNPATRPQTCKYNSARRRRFSSSSATKERRPVVAFRRRLQRKSQKAHVVGGLGNVRL